MPDSNDHQPLNPEDEEGARHAARARLPEEQRAVEEGMALREAARWMRVLATSPFFQRAMIERARAVGFTAEDHGLRPLEHLEQWIVLMPHWADLLDDMRARHEEMFRVRALLRRAPDPDEERPDGGPAA